MPIGIDAEKRWNVFWGVSCLMQQIGDLENQGQIPQQKMSTANLNIHWHMTVFQSQSIFIVTACPYLKVELNKYPCIASDFWALGGVETNGSRSRKRRHFKCIISYTITKKAGSTVGNISAFFISGQ